jgi:fibronectin-binding autotransporter adhesin
LCFCQGYRTIATQISQNSRATQLIFRNFSLPSTFYFLLSNFPFVNAVNPMKDSSQSFADDSSIDRRAKRLDDPTFSNRAFAIFFIVTILIAIALLLAPKAGATSLYWDSNGATTGAGTTPTGTWGTSVFWNTNSTGGAGTFSTDTLITDDLFFSAGTDATGTFTVGMKNNTSESAKSITVEEGNVTINQSAGNGSTLSIGAGGITINSGAQLTISGLKLDVALTAAQSWTNNSSNLFTVSVPVTNGANLLTISGTGNTTISGVIGNGSGGLTKSGVGTLTLSGANTYTGATTISAGVLSVSSLANGGVASDIGQSTNAAANLAFNGGTLQYTGGNVSTDRNFTINTGKTATIDVTTAATNLTISGGSTATNGALTKIGAGTLTLNGANNYSGATTVNNGTLTLDNNNTTTARLVNTSGITVNSGGTLLLAQSGGTASINRIKDSATINLGAGATVGTGGIFNTGGLNEGPVGGAAGSIAAMGALTLNANSTIDFTSANSSNLLFSSLTYTAGTAVRIEHWTGTFFADNGAATNDRLLFISTTGLTTAQLASVQFTDDAGALMGTGATQISFNGYFELVPVPEPSTWIGGALTMVAIGYSQRKRLRGLFGRAA